ncbi:50S ribosomal protein L15 [Trichlorobacter ammonificans]|uniref:Large ribosomal subunit protein uL15 n=1 Tax=Trichlorobacter ammonificans TaxID=2916410 RepID=A0ABN8HHF5_9BACT|nr:50S ribosomal protein L15 [Trichlorobacter ammonificans]CAH2030599.1 50S ribosomal subunit protein L15 [Trichlorobacter ammonificans]
MELNTLSPAPGSTKNKKRIGRGIGSGHGKTATKGHKGQKARSGGSVKPGFEGGQMPLQRRLPKRGFRPLARTEYVVINLSQLDVFETGSTVDRDAMDAKGLLKKSALPVKVLANGSVTKALNIKADKFSKAAADKIAAAGGSIEEPSRA